MITEFTKYGTHYRIFDDVTEALDKVPRAADSQHIGAWRRYEHVGENFTVWQQVLDKARHPNPVVVKAVEAMIEELEGIDIPQPMVHKRRPRFREDTGDEIDLDRLRGGQPYWRTCERQASVGSQVKTLVINMSTRLNIDVESIHWRGAAALVLCHLLETAGYQCEIWAVHVCSECYTNRDDHFHAIRLKDAFGSIDIDTMSTVISGWFYRSVWHALKERHDLPGVDIKSGLGAPQSISVSTLREAEIPMSAQDADLVIIQDIFSEWSAESLVKRVLGQYAEPEIDEEPYTESTEAYTPAPYVPPPPLSAAECRRQEAEDRKAQREYAKRVKAWQKENREA